MAPCTHPPPQGVQTNLGKFLLVLESPILIEILSFIWQWSGLPAHSQLERYWWGVGCVCGGGWGGEGGVGENIQGILMVKTVSGAWLKDTEKFPPSQKILGGGLA